MTAGAAGSRMTGWQFILADLALILFLLALTALPVDAEPGEHERGDARQQAASGSARRDAGPVPSIAPAHTLYRPVPGGPGLARWLADQPHDPRATLTIFARFTPGEERTAWKAAEALMRDGATHGFPMRAIISAGEEPDLYASLAYDARLPTSPP
jgi:hypothetical protein